MPEQNFLTNTFLFSFGSSFFDFYFYKILIGHFSRDRLRWRFCAFKQCSALQNLSLLLIVDGGHSSRHSTDPYPSRPTDRWQIDGYHLILLYLSPHYWALWYMIYYFLRWHTSRHIRLNEQCEWWISRWSQQAAICCHISLFLSFWSGVLGLAAQGWWERQQCIDSSI